ncbi:MAG: hypothetical protein QOI21_3491 [Actinomycetota bacterium]|jgi:hypothetical protein|nr:hypothetical protein [Actinomycetota bacterium]
MRDDREPQQTDEPVVGMSGARFPSAKQRKKLKVDEPAPIHVRRHRAPAPESSPVGRAGARFPSSKVIERLEEPVAEPVRPPEPPYVPTQPVRPQFQSEPEPEPEMPDGAPRTLVRPYVLTKGRTKSSRHLAIETLISAKSDSSHWHSTEITGEFQSVRSLCRYPRSVAEVAAVLSVPLGVARVLLCDMADLGLVSVHDSATGGDGRPAIALMERVLQGLRRI